jgi:hypothetical protein
MNKFEPRDFQISIILPFDNTGFCENYSSNFYAARMVLSRRNLNCMTRKEYSMFLLTAATPWEQSPKICKEGEESQYLGGHINKLLEYCFSQVVFCIKVKVNLSPVLIKHHTMKTCGR